jgi:hypothetical protein
VLGARDAQRLDPRVLLCLELRAGRPEPSRLALDAAYARGQPGRTEPLGRSEPERFVACRREPAQQPHLRPAESAGAECRIDSRELGERHINPRQILQLASREPQALARVVAEPREAEPVTGVGRNEALRDPGQLAPQRSRIGSELRQRALYFIAPRACPKIDRITFANRGVLVLHDGSIGRCVRSGHDPRRKWTPSARERATRHAKPANRASARSDSEAPDPDGEPGPR